MADNSPAPSDSPWQVDRKTGSGRPKSVTLREIWDHYFKGDPVLNAIHSGAPIPAGTLDSMQSTGVAPPAQGGASPTMLGAPSQAMPYGWSAVPVEHDPFALQPSVGPSMMDEMARQRAIINATPDLGINSSPLTAPAATTGNDNSPIQGTRG